MSLGKIALILVAVFALSSTGQARPHKKGRAHASRKHAAKESKRSTKQAKADTKKSGGDMLAGLPGF